MTKSLRVSLGNRDQLLKKWWNLLVSEEQNVSATIIYCIMYYIKTGEFLEIARLSKDTDTKESKAVDKKIYLPDSLVSSTVHSWLMEKQAQGEKSSTIVKRIIRNCIKELTNDSNYIMPLDEIIMAVENVERNISKSEIVQVRTDNSYVNEKMTLNDENQIQAEEESGSNVRIISYEEDDDSETQEEIDLYGLIGHQLDLG